MNNEQARKFVEKECLYYYLQGLSFKETAKLLKLSPRTVESYLAAIRAHLHSHNPSYEFFV